MLLGDFVLRCFLWRKNSALTVVLRFTGYTTRTSIASYNPGPKSGRQSAKATCDTSLKMGSHYSSFLTPTPPPSQSNVGKLAIFWMPGGGKAEADRKIICWQKCKVSQDF